MAGRMAIRKKWSGSYHHGDLERALVDSGLAIIEHEGLEALSLRAVARRAKVSHTAPYHHFSGKSELLAAVAAAGFDQMVATIQKQAIFAPSGDPFDRLRAVGRGYVTFALGHPSVFRLMFRPELTSPGDHTRLLAAEARAFSALLEAIVSLQQAGMISGRDPRPPSAFAWSGVHGLSMLHLDEVFAETPVGKLPIKRLAATINEAIISGLKAHAW
jgi:AcrR family transcriptional regulator